MKIVKVWDKKESINGIEAERVMESQKIGIMEEIFLIVEGERVKEIQRKSVIVSNYNLDANLSCLEVAQKYLEIKQQEEQKQQEEIENKLTQQEEIEQIKQENASINYILMKNDLL